MNFTVCITAYAYYIFITLETRAYYNTARYLLLQYTETKT